MSAGALNRPDFEPLGMRAGRSIRHPLTRTLLVLTFTTGLVDAVSYLGLGHVFTANMTGGVPGRGGRRRHTRGEARR
jgi:hypothetical protein